MSESGDYSPGDWKGYDFDAARKSYDVHVGRSYNDAKADNKRAADLVPTSITTDSPAPLIVLCDVTGSMGDWPATIFSKLPYMDHECREYLGQDMEISFAAVGDAYADNYPIQIRPFQKGTQLKSELESLVIEGGGGSQSRESYELTCLYYARNAEMPKAKNPILIIIGDECFHPTVLKKQAKAAHIDVESDMSAEDIFDELTEKYSVYLIRKPYTSRCGDMKDAEIQKKWADILGGERIALLPAADRVVDVIFGILAKEKNRVEYFRKEIEERQKKDQVDTVYKSLKTIHAIPAKNLDGKSIMISQLKGTPTKHLLP
jgi:hypothetical protein